MFLFTIQGGMPDCVLNCNHYQFTDSNEIIINKCKRHKSSDESQLHFSSLTLPSDQVISSSVESLSKLRTVPTIVTAHTFCASRDTRVVPANTGIFLRGLKLCRESRT